LIEGSGKNGSGIGWNRDKKRREITNFVSEPFSRRKIGGRSRKNGIRIFSVSFRIEVDVVGMFVGGRICDNGKDAGIDVVGRRNMLSMHIFDEIFFDCFVNDRAIKDRKFNMGGKI